MIIVFVVELAEGRTEKLPVSCQATDIFSKTVSLLRKKLGLAHGIPADIRTKDGAPVQLTSTIGALGFKNMDQVFVFIDQRDAVEQVELLQVPKVLEDMIAASSPAAEEEQTDTRPLPEGKVTTLGPKVEELPDGDSELDSEDEDEDAAQVGALNAGLHSIKVNGEFLKSYSRGNVQSGGIIWMEEALLSILYPKQLVETIKNNERLNSRSHDRTMPTQESSISGMSNETFTKYVSIATTHGMVVNAKGTEHGQYMAFYPEMISMRHSCAPNAYMMRNKKRLPYRAVLRCARVTGINQGEEVNMLYHKLDLMGFLLLPADRRQSLTEKYYHFSCKCDRCRREAGDETEATLTGAFFADSVDPEPHIRQGLSAEMRKAFTALSVLAPSGLPNAVKETAPVADLLGFLAKYGAPDAPLKLHRNHWRLSFVRLALISRVVHEQKDANLTKAFFGHVLDQLAVESTFAPRGHPLTVITYRRFLKMQRRLPDALSAAVQRRAVNLEEVDWVILKATSEKWR